VVLWSGHLVQPVEQHHAVAVVQLLFEPAVGLVRAAPPERAAHQFREGDIRSRGDHGDVITQIQQYRYRAPPAPAGADTS